MPRELLRSIYARASTTTHTAIVIDNANVNFRSADGGLEVRTPYPRMLKTMSKKKVNPGLLCGYSTSFYQAQDASRVWQCMLA